MLAMLQQSVTQTDVRFAESVKSGESPLETLYAAVLDRFRAVSHPDMLANSFAFLMIEISDPEFHVLAAESANNAITGYRTILEAAVEAGELNNEMVNTQELAETIHALTWGALMMWAIIRMLSPQDRLKRSLDMLLTPYRRELTGASSFGTKAAAKGPETNAPAPTKN